MNTYNLTFTTSSNQEKAFTTQVRAKTMRDAIETLRADAQIPVRFILKRTKNK